MDPAIFSLGEEYSPHEAGDDGLDQGKHSTDAVFSDKTEARTRQPAVCEGHGQHLRTQPQQVSAVSGAQFAQMTETFHLRRQAVRHSTATDTPSLECWKSAPRALPSSDLNEIMVQAGQVEPPSLVICDRSEGPAADRDTVAGPDLPQRSTFTEEGECTETTTPEVPSGPWSVKQPNRMKMLEVVKQPGCRSSPSQPDAAREQGDDEGLGAGPPSQHVGHQCGTPTRLRKLSGLLVLCRPGFIQCVQDGRADIEVRSFMTSPCEQRPSARQANRNLHRVAVRVKRPARLESLSMVSLGTLMLPPKAN